MNDTIVGDPLFTIPLNIPEIQDLGIDSGTLCFEVHGEDDKNFNLLSDTCTSVNAHYTEVTDYLNVVDSIAVRAVDLAGECKNITVDLTGCSASIDGTQLNESDHYRSEGISVRRYSGRVRISVPNGNNSFTLVMWAICQTNTLTDPFTEEEFQADMIKFVIARGLNLNESSHGLLGKSREILPVIS